MAFNFSRVAGICFDVDSTVCQDEGIDALAQFYGKFEEVQTITSQAMSGDLDFTRSLERRLDLLGLTKCMLTNFMKNQPVRVTPGVVSLFKVLQCNRVEIFLVSGGIYELVKRVAEVLEIPDDHIYANRLIYGPEGVVVDFDHSQPTARSDGKRDVVAAIKELLAPEATVLMVGDGMTDAAACPPADAFLGFGGVVTRPAVRRSTPYFFESFEEMHRFFQANGVIRKCNRC